MANAAFGIEHPLVSVHDIGAVAARYQAIGFDPTPLGRHPWGTVNRLIMFPDNFIELKELKPMIMREGGRQNAPHFQNHLETA